MGSLAVEQSSVLSSRDVAHAHALKKIILENHGLFCTHMISINSYVAITVLYSRMYLQIYNNIYN